MSNTKKTKANVKTETKKKIKINTKTNVEINVKENVKTIVNEKKKKNNFSLSIFSIILILIFLIAIISHLLPDAEFIGNEIVNGSGTVDAKLSDVLMVPILGFESVMDISIFIIILGGFLAITTKTGTLETGIQILIRKLKGRELILIPILMFIFSMAGTTYGMFEETIGFYFLLAVTMMAAGMDPLVGAAIVLLGTGSGLLGSMINPYTIGATISALPSGIEVNQGLIVLIGMLLWLTSLAISIIFVVSYASKVKKVQGSTFLSLREQKEIENKFGSYIQKNEEKNKKLNVRQKITLILFALTFIIMIVGFIPWNDFNISLFDKFTGWLTGSSFGNWHFYEAALLFLIMAIIISIINKMKEKDIIDTFIEGASDMIKVILIITTIRGVSVLINLTYLDNYIIHNAANTLNNMPELLFTPLNYLLHVVLSVLVPSSSKLATLSTPIIGSLANQLGYSVEVSVMSMVAGNGLANLITPTCGAIIGGLTLAKIEYSTWFKWAFKIVITILLTSIIVLSLATLMF